MFLNTFINMLYPGAFSDPESYPALPKNSKKPMGFCYVYDPSRKSQTTVRRTQTRPRSMSMYFTMISNIL